MFIILLTFHEWGHAKSADMLGDSTARDQGRMSLNPGVHIDIVGTIILPLFASFFGGAFFGWAKTGAGESVQPQKTGRRDLMLIAGGRPFHEYRAHLHNFRRSEDSNWNLHHSTRPPLNFTL